MVSREVATLLHIDDGDTKQVTFSEQQERSLTGGVRVIITAVPNRET
jgi:hypothetical protein